MNLLSIIDDFSGFTPNAVLIGEGQPADRVWTRGEYLKLCHHLRNDNPPNEFLHVYCDSNCAPRFVKAKSPDVEKRIAWTWDTITGKAKHPVAIGFYPWTAHGQSRWAAIDFDAHDGDAVRAKALALAALQFLRNRPEFHLILATSGSEGWHLFVFSGDFHPVEHWVRLLKQVADNIGTEIKTGICEIFPHETRNRSRPHAIRAPGTWNPKTNQVGAIFFESTGALLQKKEEKEVSSFLYYSTDGANIGQLNDSCPLSFYCGGHQRWLEQFAIMQPSTRHVQLRELVYCIFRQVSQSVGRRIADLQYQSARVQPKATLADHLEEFEQLWTWIETQWRAELSIAEKDVFLELKTGTERDLFRIVKNFARHAAEKKHPDFPFPIQHVAARLGVSFQYVSKLRQRFIGGSIIVETAAARTNQSAARFRWVFPNNNSNVTAA